MAKKFTKLTAGGGGLDINGVIEQYKVEAGANVNAGDFVEFVNSVMWGSGEFTSNAVTYVSACKLGNDKVLVAYQDKNNSNYGTAIVLTVSGTTITVGSPVVFVGASTNYIRYTYAVALTDSKVLVAYSDWGNSDYGTAIVLTVSGTAISIGTAKVFESAKTYDISAVALTDSKVLVAYRDSGNSSYGTAVVLTISGTTITVGTPTVFERASTNYTYAVALTDSKVLVAYRDSGNSSYGTAVVLTISGTTITVGTPTVFDYNAITYTPAIAFSESSVFVAYNNGTGAYCGLTIEGTTIKTQDEVEAETFVKPATSRDVNVGVAKTSGTAGETVDVYCVSV